MIKFFKAAGNAATERLSEYEKGCWIDLINPTDDEVDDVCALTGLPEEMIKAALDEEETARCERDDDAFLCLLDTPTITETDDGDSYGTLPVALIHNPNCIVTVSLRGNPVLGDFISNRVAIDTTQPVLFMLTFMMGNAKRFLAGLRQIDKKSLRVQAELHRSMKNKEIIQMLELENSLVYFSTSLSANMAVYHKMGRMSAITENEEYQDLYDDVVIETRQAVEMCTVYRDILAGTMDSCASIISNNMNIVMKLLTVVTLIISIPTLIASIWGMNVDVPFGTGFTGGFWIVIAICIVATVVSAFFLIRSTNSIKIKTAHPKRKQPRAPHDSIKQSKKKSGK
ncbi:MAG: magnesium transporter CorA family protein [Clostridia bacterium]|nr:magnesium transporter CorA family protein [Clostridia bacterium]MDE6676469.1 magnesium transporter CorA family protein [Clostridia bacterium]